MGKYCSNAPLNCSRTQHADMIHHPEIKQDWPFHSYLSGFMLATDTQGVGWWCGASSEAFFWENQYQWKQDSARQETCKGTNSSKKNLLNHFDVGNILFLFFFFSIQSPLIPTENFPQVSKLQAGATETMSPSKEPTWPPFCCQLLHSQKGFNCCQNYPKRFKQNLLFPVHPWANCYYSCVMDGLYRDHVVEKKDALWQNCISAFCYLYSASHLTDFRLDINEWNNLSQDKNHNFHLELVMLLI